MKITRVFIILFYICAVTILLSDAVQAIVVPFKLPDMPKQLDIKKTIELNFFNVTEALHGVVYTGLVL